MLETPVGARLDDVTLLTGTIAARGKPLGKPQRSADPGDGASATLDPRRWDRRKIETAAPLASEAARKAPSLTYPHPSG